MKLFLIYTFCFLSFVVHAQCGFIEEQEKMPLEIGTSRVYEYSFYYGEELNTYKDTLKIISNFEFEGTNYPVYKESGIYKYVIWVEDDIVLKGVYYPNLSPPKIIDKEPIALVNPSVNYKLFLTDSIVPTFENTSLLLNGCEFENVDIYTFYFTSFDPPEISKKVYFKSGIGILLTEKYEQNKVIETETLIAFNENKLITNLNTKVDSYDQIIDVNYYDLFGRLINNNESFRGIAIKVSKIVSGTEITFVREKVLL